MEKSRRNRRKPCRKEEFMQLLFLSETDMPDLRPIRDLNMSHRRTIGDCHALSETNMPGQRPTYMPNRRDIGD